MSERYMSSRYLANQRVQLPFTSFHGERNLPRSRRSPYSRDETNPNHDDSYSSSKYSREGRHISDHRIREHSPSPRDRSHFSSRRSQEPDLRDYLVLSHRYNRKLSDIEREGPNYNKTFKDYDRNIDMMHQESIDLRNRELLSRRDYRDEKYSFDSERDRHFSDFRNEQYDTQRGRYSPDHRDQVYLPEPRRDDHFDYRDKMYLTDSWRETDSSDFREQGYLSRGWTSPGGRQKESSDATRWHRDQHSREFLTESDRHWPTTDEKCMTDFERDWRHPDQCHQNDLFASQRDLRCSEPRYLGPSIEYWRDRYQELRYESDYNGTQGMMPTCDARSLDSLNHQDHRMDYPTGDNWKNGRPSHWNTKENFVSTNISEIDNRRLASFSSLNNAAPPSEIIDNPFVAGVSLSKVKQEGDPLPKFTVLIQYLYNFNQPLSDEHIDNVKNIILDNWNEDRMKRFRGNWLPTFLECIPRHNGLAVICADKRSFRWLLNRRIKGCKGFFFAATSAANPLKRVKLCFQIPGCNVPPNEILRKFQQCNRGSQINFERFRVLNCKKGSNGNLSIVVLADSWSANKLKKKFNWRPLYGNRRIRMNLMGKKKKRPTSTQPGEIKQPTKDDGAQHELDEIEDDSLSESYDEL